MAGHPWMYSENIHNSLAPRPLLSSPTVRIAVLDRGPAIDGSSLTVALLVPKGRERDYLFSTKSGMISLIRHFSGVSRLVLVANIDPIVIARYTYQKEDPAELADVQNYLQSVFVQHLVPAPVQDVKFVSYSDGLLQRYLHASIIGSGSDAGEHLINDDVFEEDGKKIYRRRFVSSSTGGWVHGSASIYPMQIDGQTDFGLNLTDIVDEYAKAIVYSVRLVRFPVNTRKTALIIGAKGGMLSTFFYQVLGFKVGALQPGSLGSIQSSLFGYPLQIDGNPCLFDAEPEHFLEELATPGRFDTADYRKIRSYGYLDTPLNVLVLDVVRADEKSFTGLCGPPRVMVTADALERMKIHVAVGGVFIIHVVAPDCLFLDELVNTLKGLKFEKIYIVRMKIDFECVVVAYYGDPSFDQYEDVCEALESYFPSPPKIEQLV